MKHVYIAGPMRGYDGYNFPAFFAAEAWLRQHGATADICNPAREDVMRFGLRALLDKDPTGLIAGRHLSKGKFDEDDLRTAMAADMAFIAERCDTVYVLDGWEDSAGARAEVALAEALGLEVVPLGTVTTGLLPDPVAVHTEVRPGSGEVRTTSATGGQKGMKGAQFDQLSPEVEWLIAEHFGKGAAKYAPHNFRKGYPWSLSYSALRRHLAQFWNGEEYDACPDDGAGCSHVDADGRPYESEPGTCFNHTGSLHIVAAIWHAMALTEFFLHHKEFDDRHVYPPKLH